MASGLAGWSDRRLIGASALLLLALLIGKEWLEEGAAFGWAELAGELVEKGLLVGAAAALTTLLLRLRAQEERTQDLGAELARIRERGQSWRQESAVLLQELGRAIDAQFRAWRLTAAEREVALLLLKGFSLKEIARLRRTAEATVRQQAATVYQKGELGGRAGLAAYFLEGLFLPDEAAVPGRARPIEARPAEASAPSIGAAGRP